MAKPVSAKRPEPPLLMSCRLNFFILTFFANLIVMLLRSNMNFGLVCMVKPIRHAQLHNETEMPTISPFLENLTTPSTVEDSVTELPRVKRSEVSENLAEESEPYCQSKQEDTSGPYRPARELGVFEWDKGVQAHMLAAFFYGNVFTNVLGGWVADKYGGKNCLIAAVGSISVLTVLSPIAALQGPDFLFASRFIQGVTQGTFLPLLTVLAARWAGSTERGFLLGITFAGFNVGIFIANPLSAFLCKSLGWSYIFYIQGGMGIAWCIICYFFIFDWPEDHPRIRDEELTFLKKHRAVQPGTTASKKLVVPWRSILTSCPINVSHFLHFCMIWALMTLSMGTPLFFKEILKMDVRTNGILTSVPFLGMLVVHLFSGSVFDSIRRRNWCSVTTLRKIFNTIGTASFALCLPLIYFFSCDNNGEIVGIFLTLSFVELAFTGGYLLSVYELAPRFAGIISGIMNTFGVLPGFICPVLAALLTPNDTREEWLIFFYIGSAVMGAGCILYILFGSSELQPWAAVQKPKIMEEAEMEVLKPIVDTVIVDDETAKLSNNKKFNIRV